MVQSSSERVEGVTGAMLGTKSARRAKTRFA